VLCSRVEGKGARTRIWATKRRRVFPAKCRGRDGQRRHPRMGRHAVHEVNGAAAGSGFPPLWLGVFPPQ